MIKLSSVGDEKDKMNDIDISNNLSRTTETSGDSSSTLLLCRDEKSNTDSALGDSTTICWIRNSSNVAKVSTDMLSTETKSHTVCKEKNKNKNKKKEGSDRDTNKLTNTEKSILSEQGYTRGLLDALQTNRNEFLYSIWIADNSISMNVIDGHRIDPVASKNGDHPSTGAVTFTNCSRWEEIQQTLDYHAQMAAIVKAPTMFCFVNEPSSCSPEESGFSSLLSSSSSSSSSFLSPKLLQQFTVSAPMNTKKSKTKVKHTYEDLDVAQKIIQATKPSGQCTPLTETIRNARDNIIPKLLRTTDDTDGKRIVLVIATDGVLADVDEGIEAEAHAEAEFIETLASLKNFPVWIVVRLCTDNDKVVDYWNNLNLDGVAIDVLDDYVSEAKEVYAHNKWLNYGLPLHRLREMGFYDDVFDLLDERPLTRKEIIDFCTILLGQSVMAKAPTLQSNTASINDEYDCAGGLDDNSCRSFGSSSKNDTNTYIHDTVNKWDAFCIFVEAQLKKEKMLWNPIRKQVELWINIKELRKIPDDQQSNGRRVMNRQLGLFRSSSVSTLRYNSKNINPSSIKSPSTPSPATKGTSRLLSSLVQFVVGSPIKKTKNKVTGSQTTTPNHGEYRRNSTSMRI
jgi:hypothetical protein